MSETATSRDHCVWSQDGGMEDFVTSCGNAFQFNHGGSVANGFGWCPYCGLPLVEVLDDDMGEV